MMIEQQTIVPEIQPEPVRPAPEPASGRGPRRLVVLGAVVLVFILGAWGAFFLGRAPAEAPAEPNASSENPAVSQPPAEQAKLVFEPLPEIIAPLTPVDLRFKVATQTGLTIFDFNILNDRVLHTAFVRKDLRYFFHLHPRFETNTGTFSQTFSFPTPGEWRVIVDAAPVDLGPVTLVQDITVDGPYEPQALSPGENFFDSPELATIKLALVPAGGIKANQSASLHYQLTSPTDGLPLADLKNYLGTLGHAVVIKEGSLESAHLEATDQPAALGIVNFEHTFRTPGRYRVFAQFSRAGQIFNSFNTLDVQE